ncbi:iron-sulfur cluster assembly protein [Rhodococcus opacus]
MTTNVLDHDTDLRGQVMASLNKVQDPCSVAAGRPMGLVDMGLVDRVDIADGIVDVYLRLTSPACYLMTFIESATITEVKACPTITDVHVHPDEGLDWSPTMIAPHLRTHTDPRYNHQPTTIPLTTR